MTEPAIMTRQELGTLAAPILPPPWADSLQQALGWNRRTCERLGTPKMPLDMRRAQLVARTLAEGPAAHVEASQRLADAIYQKIDPIAGAP